MASSTDDDDVAIEQVNDEHLIVTIDGDPMHVFVEQWFSSHHHFGRFRTIDELVSSARKYRRENAERTKEIAERQRLADEEASG